MVNKTLISVEDLFHNLNQPDLIIIDCSFELSDPAWGLHNYLHGHIPGAYYADLDKNLSSKITSTSGRHPLPDIKKFIHFCSQMGINETSLVVLYDTVSGAFAGRLWWLLRSFGHYNVKLLNGGYKAWIDKGFPTDKKQPSFKSMGFEGNFSKLFYFDTKDMEIAIKNNNFAIIDARSPTRYSGEEEPIDSVAGHIPGAINIFHQDNLDKNGNFKSTASLRKIYQSAISNINPDNIVVYCGSGVTSCLNLIALSIIGFDNVRLYLGSWSEWIRNQEHPMITLANKK